MSWANEWVAKHGRAIDIVVGPGRLSISNGTRRPQIACTGPNPNEGRAVVVPASQVAMVIRQHA